MLREAGFALLDCQFMTDHLASMGAVEMPQADYLKLLAAARGGTDRTLIDVWREFDAGGPYSSPGKLIAQSLTQTS